MPNHVHRAWQEVLPKLSELLQLSGDERPSARVAEALGMKQTSSLLSLLRGMPGQPAAVWMDLIANMQVPQKLGELCSTSSNPNTPVQRPGSVGTVMFVYAVTTLLKQASNDRMLLCSPATQAFRAALQQQMLQSGLLQGLTQLKQATSQQLEHCNAAAGSTSAAAAAAAITGGASSRSKGDSAAAVDLDYLQYVAAQLFNIHTQLLMLFMQNTPDGTSFIEEPYAAAFAGNAAAVVQLTVAAARNISACLQQQQQQQQGCSSPPSRTLLTLALKTAIAVTVVSGYTRNLAATALHCTRAAPCYVAWSVLTAVVAVYAGVLQQQQCLPEVRGLGSTHSSDAAGSSRGPSSSSSSSSSSSRKKKAGQGSRKSRRAQQGAADDLLLSSDFDEENALQAWQEVSGQVASLPPTHARLLEQLGCSVPAAVWLAAASRRTCYPAVDVWGCVNRFEAICEGQGAAATSTAEGPAAAAAVHQAPAAATVHPPAAAAAAATAPQLCGSAAPAPEGVWLAQQLPVAPINQQAELQQYMKQGMLPAVLLYGATYQWSSSSSSTSSSKDDHAFLVASRLLVYCFESLDAWMGRTLNPLAEPPGSRQQQLLLQIAIHGRLQPFAGDVSAADELLLLTLSMLQRLQRQQVVEGRQQSLGGGTNQPSDLKHRARELAQAQLVRLLCGMAGLQASVLPVAPPGRPGMLHGLSGIQPGNSQEAQPAEPHLSSDNMPPVLSQHAPAVCKAIEAVVRHQASPTTTTAAEDQDGTLWYVGVACSAAGPALQGALPALAAADSPGSQLQLQLFSLWSSVLKCYSTQCSSGADQARGLALLRCCAQTAVFLLGCLEPEEAAAVAAAPAAAAPQSSSSSAVAAAAAEKSKTVLSSNSITSSSQGSTSGADSSTSSSTHPGLMWLVLLGRCCLLWSTWLQLLPPKTPPYALAGVLTGTERNDDSLTGYAATSASFDQALAATHIPLELIAGRVLAVLGPSNSMTLQLSACGYTIAGVTDTATALLSAVEVVLEASCSDGTALPGLVSALAAFGEALTALTAPYCCNNPGCDKVDGPSDVALVSGKSCICAGCKVARYCGKACQSQHWKQHKRVCKALAAVQQAQRSDTTSNS